MLQFNKVLLMAISFFFILSCNPSLGDASSDSPNSSPPRGMRINISNMPTPTATSGYLMYTLVPENWMQETLSAMPDGATFDPTDLYPYVQAGLVPHLTQESLVISFGNSQAGYTLYTGNMSIWQNGSEVGFIERAGHVENPRDFSNWLDTDYEIYVHNAQAIVNVNNPPYLQRNYPFYLLLTLIVNQSDNTAIMQHLNATSITDYIYKIPL